MDIATQSSGLTNRNASKSRGNAPSRVRSLAAAVWILVLLVAALCPPEAARAVPANPAPTAVQQPDGSKITVFLKGDEYFHWNEDADGYVIMKSPDSGFWVYAEEVNGKLVPTTHVVGRIEPVSAGVRKPDLSLIRENISAPLRDEREARSPGFAAAAPATMHNLVVLVNFSDMTISYTTAEYESLFNAIGYNVDGAVGSVRDYYKEVSYDQLSVVSTVVEPVTLSNGYAYYGANDAYGWDLRPREMVQQALAALEARGFDFTTVDGDGDGWVDGLTVIHAGGGEEYSGNDPDYIWSHAWQLVTTVTYDGIHMRPYHTEPARRGWDSTPSTWGITRIGVICHETGHFLGLPDLYDYDYDSRGLGYFCLMAGGSWNGSYGTSPAHMSAWCKTALNWVTPAVVSAPNTYVVNQVETNQQIYKLQGCFSSNEYFLVENRQGVGFDAGLPGPLRGILIFHVDENQSNNDDQTHYLVDLEEASGVQHLELNQNSGNDQDYFRFGNATSFTAATTPNNLSYTSNALGLNIINVSATGSSMTFDIEPICQIDQTVIDFGTVELFTSVDMPFTITNVGTGCDVLTGTISESCGEFEIISGGGAYTLTPGQNRVVQVRFTPTTLGPHNCVIETGDALCSDVSCSGVGEAAPTCAVEPDTVRFGTVQVGDWKDTTVAITNTGGGLLIGDVSELCDHFDILEGAGPFSLEHEETLFVRVRFAPAAAESDTCSLSLGSLACEDVPLFGIGEDPPFCKIEPDTVRFGIVQVGDSKDTTVVITNTGGGLLTGDAGELCDHFDILEGGGPFSIGHEETLFVRVRFTPAAAESDTCSLSLGSLACEDVPLFGFGEDPPSCVIEPDTLRFGTVATNDSSSLRLSITNTGGGLLTGDVGELCDQFSIVEGAGPFSLGNAETLFVWVKFKPTIAGEDTCSLSLGTPQCEDVPCIGTGDDLTAAETNAAPAFRLYQNYPNPFGSGTNIKYSLDREGIVVLRIYDIAGRHVRTLINRGMTPGIHTEVWDGRDSAGQKVASGIYFYQLKMGARIVTRKAVLLH